MSKSERIKFTKTAIDALSVPGIYRDSELIGFAVRVNATCKTYIVEKKVKGKAVRSTIGLHGNLTLSQARILAQGLLSQMAQGHNPNEAKKAMRLKLDHDMNLSRQHPTLEIAYNEYLKNRTLKPRTINDYNIIINDYLLDWKDIKIGHISRIQVQKKYAELTERSPAQANLAMSVFRAVFNFSIEHFLDSNDESIITSVNPIATLKAKRSWNKIKRRKGYVKQEQLADWINAVMHFNDTSRDAGTLKDFLLTLILTGFRRNECQTLKWDAVDLKYGWITSVDPKNGEAHSLPIGHRLLEVLRSRETKKFNEYVFASKSGKIKGYTTNLSKGKQKIIDETGIEFTFHDLRRTFGTIAENLDYGQYTIKRLLNHTVSGDVTEGYIQISDKKLRLAMQEIEDIVFEGYKEGE
ncbi:tyrosine-type recombinase/integrase [Acinetobacter bereziniae]|uniref:tyrosine-type recombinase/integrase n=1 Tax=Acinetobacter bereziniae TaxID=106648 RepID=UPI00190209B3|nr:tyrosine-type recombinase/integrase [Acinetobacter bereziniae]MBJ8424545.1 tyrosine-type recombinase/integrase [Acinetobacter bereziniae]